MGEYFPNKRDLEAVPRGLVHNESVAHEFTVSVKIIIYLPPNLRCSVIRCSFVMRMIPKMMIPDEIWFVPLGNVPVSIKYFSKEGSP
jgi:hypothetical protein